MTAEPRMMDPIGSLRKIARELTEIGVEVNEPFELVAKIDAASFMLKWIADNLERQFQFAHDRGRKELMRDKGESNE